LLERLDRDYDLPPVWITENGVPGDSLDDHARVEYLCGHLEALADALDDGADVRRYFVWSLVDNFEWELGYGVRFGLVHVDYDSQRRTPKVQRAVVPGLDRGLPACSLSCAGGSTWQASWIVATIAAAGRYSPSI
jgi:beta-glucosidase/6-phospho-beta-glucosidase/beta-galactosidase